MSKIIWTKEMDDFLIREFPYNTNIELAQALGVSTNSIYRRKKILNLKKEIDLIKENLSENEKRCSSCKNILSKDQFNKNKSRSDGLDIYCIKCDREKSFRYRQKKKSKLYLDKKEQEKIIELETAQSIIKCRRCGKEKKGEEFYFLKKRLKRETRCKQCQNKENNQREIQKIIKGESW